MKHFVKIMSAMLILAAVSCTKNQTVGDGHVAFEVSNNQNVTDVLTRSQVSDYTALPSASDFTITILDATSAQVWTGKVSEWDASRQLPAGNYSVTAEYGSLDEEGFDKPYFTGTQTFVVQGGQVTKVSIPVSLGNTVVKVSCSDIFKEYFKDYSFSIVRSTSTLATFVKGETRAAFVDGYKFTVNYVLQGETQKYESSLSEFTGLKAATAYTILFDIPEVGGKTITVKFNDTVEQIDLGNYELND